jgi:transcriptional regulator with XRE-family HTH domain
MKVQQREEARRLRREEGMSMKAIARHLEVSVGSVSLWTRDIALTDEQVAALAARNHRYGQQALGHLRRSENARAKRAEAQDHGRDRARQGDALHQAGCMLHWAEGSKRRNCVTFVNSDVRMLRVFMRFLEECYGVSREQYAFSVNCYLDNGLLLEEIEAWWLNELGLPRSCLRAHAVNRPSKSSKRLKRNLPYGTARLVVYSTFIAQSIYGAIQEYAGFEQPNWLD